MLSLDRCIEQVLAPLEKIDAGGELAETFLAWCKNPFAPREVAEKLAIYRNTLQYRLRKIREAVRLNPWNFHDGFTLWIALTLEKLEKNEIYCAPD